MAESDDRVTPEGLMLRQAITWPKPISLKGFWLSSALNGAIVDAWRWASLPSLGSVRLDQEQGYLAEHYSTFHQAGTKGLTTILNLIL